ncbi:hypothetical protein B0H11DRAFT_2263510 [Mycena galericulata]|nr:hypothetical protein B0H11DRAFT_2263510 [Mycena galericulata]
MFTVAPTLVHHVPAPPSPCRRHSPPQRAASRHQCPPPLRPPRRFPPQRAAGSADSWHASRPPSYTASTAAAPLPATVARRPNQCAAGGAGIVAPIAPALPLHTPRPRPLSPPSRRSPPPQHRGRPGRRAAGGGGSEEGHGGDVHRAQSAQGGMDRREVRRAAGGGWRVRAAGGGGGGEEEPRGYVHRAQSAQGGEWTGGVRAALAGSGWRVAGGGWRAVLPTVGRREVDDGDDETCVFGTPTEVPRSRSINPWGKQNPSGTECGLPQDIAIHLVGIAGLYRETSANWGGCALGPSPPPAAQPHLADVRRRPIRDYPDVLNTFALRLRPRTHRMRPRAHDRAVPHRDDHGRRRRRFERRSVSLSRDLEHCVLHILLPYAPRLTRGEPYCCARASSTVHHVLRRRIRTTPFEHSTGHARPRVAAARQSTGETKEARSSSARTPIYTPRPLRPSESAQRESRCMDPESIGRAARRTDGGLEHTHRTRRFQPASHRVPPPNPRSTTPARAPNFRRPSAAQSRGNLRGGAGSRSVKGATALSGRVCNYIQCVRYSRGSPHPRPHGHLSTECPATTPTINTSAHLIDADAVNCVVRRLPRDFSGASPSVIGECTQHPTTPQLRHLTLLPPAPAPHVSYEIFDAVDAA